MREDSLLWVFGLELAFEFLQILCVAAIEVDVLSPFCETVCVLVVLFTVVCQMPGYTYKLSTITRPIPFEPPIMREPRWCLA